MDRRTRTPRLQGSVETRNRRDAVNLYGESRSPKKLDHEAHQDELNTSSDFRFRRTHLLHDRSSDKSSCLLRVFATSWFIPDAASCPAGNLRRLRVSRSLYEIELLSLSEYWYLPARLSR
jgi:hypothetical protein